MAAVGYFTLPNFVWSVGKIETFCSKKSPTFVFADEQWRLKLKYCNHHAGPRIQIYLKRISISKNVPGLYQTKTSIIDNNGIQLLTATYTTEISKLNTCCVWESSMDEIPSLFDVYDKASGLYKKVDRFTDGYTILFSVQPSKGWSDFYKIIQSNETDTSPVVTSKSPDSLNQDIAKLFNSKVLSDIILVCGDKYIYAHKAILSARSEVFAAMFRHDVKDSQEIKDMEPYVLEQLIRFIYTGEILPLSSDSVYKIYAAADMYGLERLKMKCGLFMMDNTEETKSDNVATVVEEGNETLKERVMSQFASIKAVVMTEEWKQLCRCDSNLAKDALEFLIKRSPA